MAKELFFFGGGQSEGMGISRDVLGGKGAGLAEMTAAGIPVPPGFTIATSVCLDFIENGGKTQSRIETLQEEYLLRLETLMGRKLGDPKSPLLVSVRSGSKFSMPGMMDTVLNLGLNDASVEGLALETGNERFAWDSYRRFISMFGSVVLNISKDVFEKHLEGLKKAKDADLDTDLKAEDWQELVARFKDVVVQATGQPFPQDPRQQLSLARDAVFRSWDNPRANYYRKQNKISNSLGTAVNVQAMVYGNLGEDSGTGVGFTRNPSTGVPEFYGEFLTNAQGEDVVAGIRTPRPIAELEEVMPEVYHQLRSITDRLEKHYRDIQDFEFTIEKGELYLLQTRNGKRTGGAAVRIAVDMVEEGLIDKKTALMRVPPEQLNQLLHPRVQSDHEALRLTRGLPASPGAACGQIVFTADEAFRWAEEGKQVILVRAETNPDDIHGMDASEGILTSRGGMTSHAAVVARGMGTPCVAGAGSLDVDVAEKVIRAGDTVLKEGDWITMDGGSGDVFLGKAPLEEPELSGHFNTFMEWTDEYCRLQVRANADLPRDAKKAREFGAQGIGLCRTEHMFFGDDRIAVVRRMIMSAGEFKTLEKRLAELRASLKDVVGEKRAMVEAEISRREQQIQGPQKNYQGALEKLLPLQREDFLGVFRAMDGYPVTIRTLDPPLHEFLPSLVELQASLAKLEASQAPKDDIDEARGLCRRVEALHEMNPMLGHRGCRLGITYPEITAMQARAILEAACALTQEGITVLPEIMIPLVGFETELADQRAIVDRVASQVMKETGVTVKYLVGTMIEVPRAALTAGEIAKSAEFFSFGTNDLTQLTLGFSRDDVAKFLPEYIERGILPEDPFVSLDQSGVGDLVRLAVARGRAAKPDIKLGICGEHGGDPDSIGFCHREGLAYVSCSPFRVPIARLAAAQAALQEANA